MLTDKQRIQRLEDLVVLLSQHAAHGEGMQARPLYDFVYAIRDERDRQAAERLQAEPGPCA